MARPMNGANLSIAQLEKMLNERKLTLIRLEKERKDLQKKLDAVNAKIIAIGGVPGAGGRVRNDKSLPETLEQVLRAAGRAMKVGEIAAGVSAAGYHSNSRNFRAIINQTLIKERKRFAPSGVRGTYQLKKP